jgi:uncharacterized protein (DUF362 family)/NAD-dependent dihydropyrimidine dehydrogenase PreA subunit
MKVAFFYVKDYDIFLIEEKIKKGIDLIGGYNSYFNKDEKILLKPNLLSSDDPEKGVITHPIFFEAVVRYFKNQSANIKVGDSPAISSSLKVAKESGILEICEKYNIDFIEFKEKVTIKGNPQNIVKSFEISKEILCFDKIVSLPKLKNHSLTIFTGGIKNLFGVIPGKTKAFMHTRFPDPLVFSKMIVDLADSLKTGICIMDGIIAHEGQGPRGGNPIKLGYLIIGENPFIVDLLAVKLVGYNPKDIPFLAYYSQKHNVSLSLEDHRIYGDNLLFNNNFKKISIDKIHFSSKILKNSFIYNKISSKPYFVRKKCTMCLECLNICPTKPKSILLKEKKVNFIKGKIFNKNKYLKYNYNTCIRCFCCQEICPSKAIKIKDSIVSKILRKI